MRLADPVVQVGLRVLSASAPSLTFNASVKAPIADTSGFGTGRWDAGGGASASLRSGPHFLGIDVSFWHFGDLPAVDFRDVGTAAVTVGRLTTSGWGWSGTVTGNTTIIPEFDPPVAIGGSIVRGGRRGIWGLNAAIGITEMTPDFTVGTFWSIRLWGRRSGR